MRVAGISSFAILALTAVVPAADPSEPDLLAAIEKRLKAVNDKTGPCVACIVVSRSDRYPKPSDDDDPPGKLGGYNRTEFLKTHPKEGRLALSLDLSDPLNIADHGYACGVVIDSAGLILTPYHVVEGATKIYVHLPGHTGSYADIYAADSRHDLAVLKLISPPAGLTAIKFGDARTHEQNRKPATITKGKLTVLLANNFVPNSPLDKASAALGSVKSIFMPKKRAADNYYLYGPLLVHDAKLNTGIDGAALVNLDGEMIGLATSTPTLTGERGPHYAFPVDEYFRSVVEVLRRGEEVEYGYLGVGGPLEDTNGMRFERVMAQGPAELAGMKDGDMLTHVNGYPTATYDELLLRIGSALAGSKVKVTLVRAGRERDVEVTLGKYAHKNPFIATMRPEPVFGLRVDYNSVLAQGQQDARGLGNGIPKGVSVREIVADSPAATAFKPLPGAAERWLITHVNGNVVKSPSEFYKAAKGQKSIKLTLLDPTELNPRDREVTLP